MAATPDGTGTRGNVLDCASPLALWRQGVEDGRTPIAVGVYRSPRRFATALPHVTYSPSAGYFSRQLDCPNSNLKPTPHIAPAGARFGWFVTGDEFFAAATNAITAAEKSIRLEMYIYASDALGMEFRELLAAAAHRGVKVQLLVDYLGSQELPDAFWDPIRKEGGEVRWFNPTHFRPVRDHRKILVCDDQVGLVGGFNFSEEYRGDGIVRGWRDVGLMIEGGVSRGLSAAFDEMFARANSPARPFARFRRRVREVLGPDESGAQLLLASPGRGQNSIIAALGRDLKVARDVRIMVPYFLPGTRLRRKLQRVSRRGGRVQLIVPGVTDVPLAQLGARGLYQRLFRAGIEIYEYQPQILHAKLYLINGIAYTGSCNLDPRSLHLNYELLIRLTDPEVVSGGSRYYEETLSNSKRVDPSTWSASRTAWQKLKERLAHFLIGKLDPTLTRWLNRD